MNDLDFQKAYEEQNKRDYIARATLGAVLSMTLNLSCSVMDSFMYPQKWWLFFKVRLCSILLVGVTWAWFKISKGALHYRIFGVMWFVSPLIIILWMIYAANESVSPYYAGLNIVLLAVGLIQPWNYIQNLLATLFTMTMYVVVCFAMPTPPDLKYIINNTTFLVLTAALVVSGSVANSRQRLREFGLRWELDKNRRAIEENNRKLKELDQVKSRFFANISHELRTPLTLLIAPLEAIRKRFNRTLDGETHSLLDTMHANGMRLLKLINDLLDLVRLESGRLEVRQEPLEVAELVKGLGSAVRQVANDKNITLETSVDPALGTVAGDRDKLEKILLNLLFNALKFTPAGGRVELRAEKHAEEFVLAVADTGVGISEKNLAFVFDRFWQADGSSKRKFQGVGIGLALVKELTEAQGGTVNVASKEGKGATFTVRLPYRKPQPAAAQTSEASAPTQPQGTVTSDEWLANLYRRAELFPGATSAKSPDAPAEPAQNGNGHLNVLVADDEPDMLRFLQSQLSGQYRVTCVVDGQQAVEKAGELLPDIILLDMMMPEKDGLQACREIRAAAATQNIPIILLTARADEETKLKSLEAGASDFLAKPFSTTELHVRVKNLIESYQLQRKLGKQNQVLESTIDQLKETESQLVQTEKLASLGRMSAGIIHEINNPLNFATTGLYTLRNKAKYLAPEQQEEYAEILKDVEEGVGRVKNIVSDLRMFTHPDTESRDQVEINDIFASALRFLSNEWKEKNIRVEKSIAEHQTVCANKQRLINVAVNLLQNSVDALKSKNFPDGEQPTIWIEGCVEDGSNILRVRDNGPGIEREHLDKIFDPFFTTKDVGEGMGLGLSICYRVVQECEGKISVKTEPGKFCEFTLEFPAKG